MESLDQFRRLEVREKARNVFAMSLRLTTRYYATLHLHQVFFRFRSDFLARILYLHIFGVKEFNITIIPFALVRYETGYSQLGATYRVDYLPSHIQRALME